MLHYIINFQNQDKNVGNQIKILKNQPIRTSAQLGQF